MNNLFYITGVRTQSFPIFVNNWAEVYPLPQQEIYLSYLNQEITAEKIKALFSCFWKGKISSSKQKILALLEENLSFIQELKTSQHPFPRIEIRFNQSIPFEERLFLLHIVQPQQFPLWNAEIMAALGYILHKNSSYFKRKQKRKVYFDFYYPMIQKEFAEIPLLKVNQAMYAFGKFLLETNIQHKKIIRF